jgi:hypothetical protein
MGCGQAVPATASSLVTFRLLSPDAPQAAQVTSQNRKMNAKLDLPGIESGQRLSSPRVIRIHSPDVHPVEQVESFGQDLPLQVFAQSTAALQA